MYKPEYAYIVKFTYNGIERRIAFTELDRLRVHIVHGYGFSFEESKVMVMEGNGEIYNQEGIVIEQVVLKR